jgi:hypothetical protein
MPLTQVSFFPGPMGQGGRVKASPLTKCPGNTVGSPPDGSIYRQEFDCINAAGQGGSWVRAHILHGRTSSSGPFNLHGPGDDIRNLIITDKSLNGQMRIGAEGPALTRVYGRKEVLWYDSKVDSYVPGLDAFAQSITVSFGAYDPRTRTEGPRLGGGTFTLKRTPPNCPTVSSALLPAPAGPEPGPAKTPRGNFAFGSTLQLCRALRSRTFHVADGGLDIRIDANWSNPSGEQTLGQETCGAGTYTVKLYRSRAYWFDETIGEQTMKVGEPGIVSWKYLDSGDYYFDIILSGGASCCLQGELTVTTFSAPKPSYEYEEGMIA